MIRRRNTSQRMDDARGNRDDYLPRPGRYQLVEVNGHYGVFDMAERTLVCGGLRTAADGWTIARALATEERPCS